MTFPLQICVLGDFQVLREGKLITALCASRMQLLIAHLVLRRNAVLSRANVAFQFWPDSTEKQALTNLRHLLHELRQVLPAFDESIASDNRTLRWRSDAPYQVDVASFDEAIAAAETARRRADHAAVKAELETAVRLYRGELLSACYEDWITSERERLRLSAIASLEQLAAIHEECREYSTAIHYLRQLQQIDSTRETTTCALMRLQLLLGDRAAALQTYQTAVATLQRELAVGPGHKLRELRDRALADLSVETGARNESGAPKQEYSLHGRHAEWRALLAAWKEAALGRASVVAIRGVAGIGKSRLAEELCAWVERQGGAVARTRSYAAEGRLAYAPATQWLRSPAVRPQLLKLESVWLAELIRILPELRAERPELREPPAHAERWQRPHLFEALSRAIVGVRQPLLLLLDDLQWADQETLEWLRFLMRFSPAAPLLLVGTARTEELSSHQALQALFRELRRHDQLTEIELGPLDIADAARVAADVAGRQWTKEEIARLYSETEGNPLFVVESVRAGWRGSTSTAPFSPTASDQPAADSILSLPPKVHAVIVTRLAQLSPAARDVAGVAAVIGRAFSFDVLAAVCARPDEELAGVLDELWNRRVIGEQGNAYDFTHDKLREVAYTEIIPPRRRWLHRRTAGALNRLYSDTPDIVRAQVAAHLEAAGDISEAIMAYHTAAEAAKRLNASDEAIRLFEKALHLLQSLPETPARALQELTTNTALGVCLVAAQGYPASQVWGIYERARELCRELDRRTDAPILRALAISSLTSGNLQRAQSLGEEILQGFEQTRDPVLYVEGHYVLGVTFFWLGRFVDSRRHLETALAGFDARWRPTHHSLYAQDPQAVCLCRLGWTLWYLGYPDQAAQKEEAALSLARELKHPHTQGYVLYFAAQCAADARDDRRAEALLKDLENLTERHLLQFWSNRGQVLANLLRARLANSKEALERAKAQMTTFSSRGDRVSLSQFLGYAAEIYLLQREPASARVCLSEAFVLLEKIDERYYCAELQRIEGELLRTSPSSADQAEARFRKAVALAREQKSKSLELRAAMRLGRWWHDRGESFRARELLQPVYGWFSEGLQTPDLVEARALLDAWA